MDSNIILEIIKEQNKYNTDVINKIMYISDNRDSEYIKKSKVNYVIYFILWGVVTTYIIQNLFNTYSSYFININEYECKNTDLILNRI